MPQKNAGNQSLSGQIISQPFRPTNRDVRLEGYLFKRTSNAFKTWNRRWFMIKDNKLMYFKRKNSTGEDVTVMELNLRLCVVKRYDLERRVLFRSRVSQ